MSAAVDERGLEDLSTACGLELDSFNRRHLASRLDRAMRHVGAGDLAELAARLQDDASLRVAFRRSVAISVTGLFRDAEQFALLEQVLLSTPARRPVRAWSAGCATGEEAWSIAATLARARRADHATVLGSDVLLENIGAARRLRPTVAELRGVRIPPTLRMRFECRDLVTSGAPGRGYDLVLCRNVAIYLDDDERRTVHAVIAGALASGGLLLLGRSERLTAPAELGLRSEGPHLYRRVAA